MSESLNFTADEIEIKVERLRHFLDAVLEPDELYEIRSVPFAKPGSHWAKPAGIPALVPMLMAWNRMKSNPYFSVNPRAHVGAKTGADSLPGSLIVADFDSGLPLVEVKSRLTAAGLPEPTAIVCTSPEHWHCYWRLDARLPDLETFKRHQQGLADVLGSCPNVSSFQQVMRLPGPFCNVKADRPDHPRVKIVACDPNRIYPATLFPLADPAPAYEAVPLEHLAIVIEKGSMADKTRALVERFEVSEEKGRRATIYEAARDMHGRGWDLADAEKVLVAVAGKLGLEPSDVEDVRRQVRNAFKTPATPGFAAAETAEIDFSAIAPAGDDDDDYNAELEAIPLPVPPPLPPRPALALAHGVVGDFMQRVELETEAHPVALATQFLVAFGNVIGRGPHALVGRTRHGLNLFTAVVGNTGIGRKGTSLDIVRDCIQPADSYWAERCHSPNLTSGEGVVDALRDKVVKNVPVKGGGPDEFESIVVDPGVEDKRLLIVCSELVSAFKASNREGSILSQTLREAWDGKTLRTLAKNAARCATDPHLSIIGHATRFELTRVAKESDVHGGTFNRFLLCLSDRVRLLPHGGDLDDLGTVPARITDAVDFARTVGRMTRTPEADRLWEELYGELTGARGSEIVAAVLSRGEAQVLRLGMLFALAAKRCQVTADDLAAAIDLWRYCRASAESIFAGVHDQLFHRVLDAITTSPGITRTRLHERLGWKLGSSQLVETLGRVQAAGMARPEKMQTAGRPVERWYPAFEKEKEKQEKPPGASPEAADDLFPPFPSPIAAPSKPPVAWDPDNLRPGTYTL
jgi:hypothetical protein